LQHNISILTQLQQKTPQKLTIHTTIAPNDKISLNLPKKPVGGLFNLQFAR
jgi:hypothetical protein